MVHLARFAKVYKGLASYRKSLVAESAEKGYPVARHLFLHYPGDPNTHELRYQFLLGPDLLVAPVLDKGGWVMEHNAGAAWQACSLPSQGRGFRPSNSFGIEIGWRSDVRIAKVLQ
jgi:hypothetical protein